MNISKLQAELLEQIDIYEKSLSQYSEADFLRKPSEDAWSVGQVYMHLLDATRFFHAKQVETAMSSDAHAGEGKNFRFLMAKTFFGGFPPIQIKVPPTPEYTPPQPQSKAFVAENLEKLKAFTQDLSEKVAQSKSKGKTKHPAFGYLTAQEWFWMIPKHFKHHLRQKGRIDEFLAQNQ
jgi:hypothetical protein